MVNKNVEWKKYNFNVFRKSLVQTNRIRFVNDEYLFYRVE